MATKKTININGILTEVWQTDASAQQIDDAVESIDHAFIARNKSIPSGDDLNDYTTPGGYYVTSANSTKILNMPVAAALQLHVFVADRTPVRILQIATRTNPIVSNGSVLWYRILNLADNMFGDWKEVATTDKVVLLDGSKAMTGGLTINPGTTGNTLTLKRTVGGAEHSVVIQPSPTTVGGSPAIFHVYSRGGTSVAQLGYNETGAIIKDVVNNKTLEILHTGNKPSGSYTGNGSAAARAIDTKGIGDAVLITGNSASWLVSKNGAVGKASASATTASGLAASACSFASGVITLATADAGVNANNATYYYQVL